MDSDPFSFLIVLLVLIVCSWLDNPLRFSNLAPLSYALVPSFSGQARLGFSYFHLKKDPLSFLLYASVNRPEEANRMLSRKYSKIRKLRGNAILSLKLYLVTQVLIVIVGMGYLFLGHPLEIEPKSISFLVAIVLGTAACIWTLAKRKRAGYVLEYLRLVVVVLFLAYLTQYQSYFKEVLFIASGIVFLFFFWLITLMRIFKR